jgi:Ni/Co efflux regulator RcnB
LGFEATGSALMTRIYKLLLAAALLLATIGTATAGEMGVDVGFSDGEISIIQAYYRDHEAASRGGKGKGGKGLPPGIAKNLQRGKPLPPGIAKQHLPSGLLAKLPPPPKGYERIEVAGKILLVEIATQVIHDVLEDVILGK